MEIAASDSRARARVRSFDPSQASGEGSKTCLGVAVHAAGVVRMVMFTHRWMPYFRDVFDLVSDGFIGECHLAEFLFITSYARAKQFAWRFDAARAHGGLCSRW